MATDAQGRQLSEDGFYYWDGTAWQLVQQDAGAQAPAAQADAAQNTGGGQEPAEKTPTADDFHAAMNIQTESETSAV